LPELLRALIVRLAFPLNRNLSSRGETRTPNLNGAKMSSGFCKDIISFAPNEEGAVVVRGDDIVVITGPNGAGKSTLISEMPAIHDRSVERFYGGRQITFTNNDTDQIGPVDDFVRGVKANVSRHSSTWGEGHLKSVIRRILNGQAQAANDIVEALKAGFSIADAELKNPLPISEINACFRAGHLTIQFKMVEGRMQAVRGDETFTIEKLSDGERAALLLAGAVVVQPKDGIFIMDEPERHMNPAICGPLLSALVRKRPDLSFVFATHDLGLINWLRPTKIIHLQDARLVSNRHPITWDYDFVVIDDAGNIPESLRYGLLGSRRALLLVEGTASSEDKSLYSLVYPDWNVLPREGWQSVEAGVRVLNENRDFHWLTVAGLIDRDGRSTEERQKLARKQVFSLPSPTIENLFLQKQIVENMAEAAASFFGGPSAADRINKIEGCIRAFLKKDSATIIARRVVWAANRLVAEGKVSISDIVGGQEEIAAIPLNPLREEITNDLKHALEEASALDALSRIPIKNTGLPSAIAHVLGHRGYDMYTKAILTHIERETEIGKRLLAIFRAMLPQLPKISEPNHSVSETPQNDSRNP
jgi:ABC-type Mn2+/Zn2+ transport system ATPase subunit